MEQTPKNVRIDLRRLNSAFVTNIKSQATGVTKRGIFIPIEDNFIEEGGYTDRAGNEVRTATIQLKQWPVDDESRERFNKKNNWELRLDISKSQREALEQRDPQLAARLAYNNAAYDRELSRQLLPYVGQGYEVQSSTLQPETTTTVSMDQSDDNNDLPF